VVIGVFLICVGGFLATAPLIAGRLVQALRFVPFGTDPTHVRQYRAMGVIFVAVGLVLALTL
jgi:hypothetical protein